MSETPTPQLDQVARQLGDLKTEIGKVVIGQEEAIKQILITILCGGHALLEGVPGTAKTLTARVLAMALSCRFKRIQFTPDLMPSDIVGTRTFNLKTNEFDLRPGPIFTDLLLADEINRAPAKTQAAMLEAMSERHATLDGERHELSPMFTVFATQNPVEFEGTYPLPEAQQDRFLLKIKIDYPLEESERKLLQEVDRGAPPDRIEDHGIRPILTLDQILAVQGQLASVRTEPGVLDYVLAITRHTRGHDSLVLGAGPRGSIHLLNASKAHALLQGRDYLTPDDVVAMVNPVLEHRVVLAAEAEISGETTAGVLAAILEKIEVPR